MKVILKKKKFEKKGIAEVIFCFGKVDKISEKNGQIKIVLAIGKKGKLQRRKLILLLRKAVKMAKAQRIERVSLQLLMLQELTGLTSTELAELVVVNFLMADYKFTRYKKEPREGWGQLKEIIITSDNKKVAKSLKEAKLVGEAVNATRDWANIPGIDMTPDILVRETKKAIKNTKIKMQVLDEKAMRRLGMGGVLCVGQGSKEPSKFIILKYDGGAKAERPLVLVGKAVTFDTGGINLKPFEGMGEMHMDMAGGAATIQAIILAAKLKLKKNIVTLVPAVENMPGGGSYRQGDIIRGMSGQTIEVGNTDAEGRIILSDALTYAEKYKPKLVIDVATLTGAAMVALGYVAAAVYASRENDVKLLQELGEKSGDYVWPMPLWEEYESEIKGTFGDYNNIGKYQRVGGANTAAAFLFQFAKKYPWIHIDIAPIMNVIEENNLEKGASGAPVRLLIELIKKIK